MEIKEGGKCGRGRKEGRQEPKRLRGGEEVTIREAVSGRLKS